MFMRRVSGGSAAIVRARPLRRVDKGGPLRAMNAPWTFSRDKASSPSSSSGCRACGGIFDVSGQEKQLAELEERAGDPALWQDATAAAQLQRDRSRLEKTVNEFKKLDKLIGAGIVLGAGALLLLPGLVLLLVALAYYLAQGGMSPATASLISSVVALAIGGVLLALGLSRLKAVRLVPNKTLRQIQQDVAVVKEVRQES